jgi:hypothetical protein
MFYNFLDAPAIHANHLTLLYTSKFNMLDWLTIRLSR